MKVSRCIQVVLLLVVLSIIASGCDFLQNQGSAASPFKLNKLVMTVQGKGNIIAQPAPLSDGTYPAGTTVQLKAVGDLRNSLWRFVMAIQFATSGAVDALNVSMFSQWTGDIVSSTNPVSLQINKDTQVQAVFGRFGVTSITTPGGKPDGTTPPPYAEILYNSGRPYRANFYQADQTTLYMSSTFIFNSAGKCTVVYARDPGGTLQSATNYSYTASGDYDKMTVQTSGYTTTIQYGYDSLGRVSSMRMISGSSWSQDMYCTYDDNGILQQMDVYFNGTYGYYLCTHDSNGNITEMSQYDQNGQSVAGYSISLVYDTNGLMSQTTMPNQGSGGSSTVNLGWQPL